MLVSSIQYKCYTKRDDIISLYFYASDQNASDRIKLMRSAHVGKGEKVSINEWQSALTQNSCSGFVRSLARSLIGKEVLKTCTVSGKPTRRSKDSEKNKDIGQIDPNKIEAIKEALRCFLSLKKNQNLNSEERNEAIEDVNHTVCELAAEMKRPSKKKGGKNVNNENEKQKKKEPKRMEKNVKDQKGVEEKGKDQNDDDKEKDEDGEEDKEDLENDSLNNSNEEELLDLSNFDDIPEPSDEDTAVPSDDDLA